MGTVFVPGTRRTHLIQKMHLSGDIIIIVLNQSVKETHRPTTSYNKNAAENYLRVSFLKLVYWVLCVVGDLCV